MMSSQLRPEEVALSQAVANLHRIEADLMPQRTAGQAALRGLVEVTGQGRSELRGESLTGKGNGELIHEFVGHLPGFRYAAAGDPNPRFESKEPEDTVNVRAATLFVLMNYGNEDAEPYAPFYIVGANGHERRLLLAQPRMQWSRSGRERGEQRLQGLVGSLVTTSFLRERSVAKFVAKTDLSKHYDQARREGVRWSYDLQREMYYVSGKQPGANVRFGKISSGFRSLSNQDMLSYNVLGYLTKLAVTLNATGVLKNILERELPNSVRDELTDGQRGE
jgi:hypothetical protein